jgi:hypothetical protein
VCACTCFHAAAAAPRLAQPVSGSLPGGPTRQPRSGAPVAWSGLAFHPADAAARCSLNRRSRQRNTTIACILGASGGARARAPFILAKQLRRMRSTGGPVTEPGVPHARPRRSPNLSLIYPPKLIQRWPPPPRGHHDQLERAAAPAERRGECTCSFYGASAFHADGAPWRPSTRGEWVRACGNGERRVEPPPPHSDGVVILAADRDTDAVCHGVARARSARAQKWGTLYSAQNVLATGAPQILAR